MATSILPRRNDPKTVRARNLHRKRNGLCFYCGDPATKETTRACLCDKCWRKRLERNKANYDDRVSKGLCWKCNGALQPGKTQCPSCLKKQINRARRRRKQTKVFIVGYFGGACKDCKEADIRTLSLDHVNGDGAEHRRQLSGGTSRVWQVTEKEIQTNGRPSRDLQLLCFNCHAKKTFGEWTLD